VKNALLGRSLVVRDKELLTGQDPLSADALGNAFLEMMKEHYGQHQ
jgi:putative intracellular protease/amidase